VSSLVSQISTTPSKNLIIFAHEVLISIKQKKIKEKNEIKFHVYLQMIV